MLIRSTPAAGISLSTTALTLLLSFDRAGECSRITFEVFSRATGSTLNAFKCVRAFPSGRKQEYFSNGDFDTAGGSLRYSSGTLTADATAGTSALAEIKTLPASTLGIFDIEPGGCSAIELWASIASGTAVIDVTGNGITYR